MTTLNSLEKHAPDLTYSLPDGSVVIHLGLIVTVYFRQGYTEQSKRAVMRCFTRFKEEFGAHLVGQFYGGYKRLTDSSFIDTTARILQTGPNDQYEWHISSAATVGEAGAYSLTILNSFEAHGDHKRSFLKMTLP